MRLNDIPYLIARFEKLEVAIHAIWLEYNADAKTLAEKYSETYIVDGIDYRTAKQLLSDKFKLRCMPFEEEKEHLIRHLFGNDVYVGEYDVDPLDLLKWIQHFADAGPIE